MGRPFSVLPSYRYVARMRTANADELAYLLAIPTGLGFCQKKPVSARPGV